MNRLLPVDLHKLLLTTQLESGDQRKRTTTWRPTYVWKFWQRPLGYLMAAPCSAAVKVPGGLLMTESTSADLGQSWQPKLIQDRPVLATKCDPWTTICCQKWSNLPDSLHEFDCNFFLLNSSSHSLCIASVAFRFAAVYTTSALLMSLSLKKIL